MKIKNINDCINGWFVGNFKNAAYQTDSCEVAYKKYNSGQFHDFHYQTEVIEINLLISGEMKIQNKKLTSGNIFIIYPYEISDAKFLTDCEIVCVKIPGITNDKISFEITKNFLIKNDSDEI